MSLGFHPPAISICISGPARTQNMLRAANTARQSDEGRALPYKYILSTLQPLNSIPGADPLLFSLDCARPATSCTNTPEARTIPLFWLPLSEEGSV